MPRTTVPERRDATALAALLDSPEIAALIADLEATKDTGRPGYGVRAMVGMALAKSLNSLPTWSRAVRLVADHDGLRAVPGCTPSEDACYRFAKRLRAHHDRLTACVGAILAALRAETPAMGQTVAIDGSDLPAYANGQRFLYNHGPERKVYSDPDASWGHRSAVSTRKGGGFYGHKVHAVVDVATEFPVAWETRTARDPDPSLTGWCHFRGRPADCEPLTSTFSVSVRSTQSGCSGDTSVQMAGVMVTLLVDVREADGP